MERPDDERTQSRPEPWPGRLLNPYDTPREFWPEPRSEREPNGGPEPAEVGRG